MNIYGKPTALIKNISIVSAFMELLFLLESYFFPQEFLKEGSNEWCAGASLYWLATYEF